MSENFFTKLLLKILPFSIEIFV